MAESRGTGQSRNRLSFVDDSESRNLGYSTIMEARGYYRDESGKWAIRKDEDAD